MFSSLSTEFRFFWLTIRKQIASSAELRTSFWLSVLGMMINNSSFLIIWLAFSATVGGVGGWRAIDVWWLQGIIALGFGLVFTFFSGINAIPRYVLQGGMDRFILTPKNILLKVCTSSIRVSAIGDVFFGLGCLVVYAVGVWAGWAELGLLALLVILASMLMWSFALFSYCISFWTPEDASISYNLFGLALTPAMMHGGAFQGRLRFFFTWIIPALCMGSIPIEIIRTGDMTALGVLTGLTLFWFGSSIALFYRGLRHYESGGGGMGGVG